MNIPDSYLDQLDKNLMHIIDHSLADARNRGFLPPDYIPALITIVREMASIISAQSAVIKRLSNADNESKELIQQLCHTLSEHCETQLRGS